MQDKQEFNYGGELHPNHFDNGNWQHASQARIYLWRWVTCQPI